MTEKYNASNVSLEQILSYIKSGEIAIPEIQRPFVWKPRQVRDLIDLNSATLLQIYLFKFLSNKKLPRILPCQNFHLS